MTETLTATEFKLMAVVASKIAPGTYCNLSDLRFSWSHQNINAIDANLGIRKLKALGLLSSSDDRVGVSEKGWDWISANRDKLVNSVGAR